MRDGNSTNSLGCWEGEIDELIHVQHSEKYNKYLLVLQLYSHLPSNLK